MPAKGLWVNGCRGDDHLEVFALWEQLLEVTEQKVNVQAALVSLVDDYGVVLGEVSIVLHCVEQDAVGHHLDQGLLRRCVSEANLVTNLLAKFNLELLGNSLRHRTSCDATRLCVCDGLATKFQAHLWNLRGLARTGGAGNYHYLVILHRLNNLLAKKGDWQVIWVIDIHTGRFGLGAFQPN